MSKFKQRDTPDKVKEEKIKQFLENQTTNYYKIKNNTQVHTRKPYEIFYASHYQLIKTKQLHINIKIITKITN